MQLEFRGADEAPRRNKDFNIMPLLEFKVQTQGPTGLLSATVWDTVSAFSHLDAAIKHTGSLVRAWGKGSEASLKATPITMTVCVAAAASPQFPNGVPTEGHVITLMVGGAQPDEVSLVGSSTRTLPVQIAHVTNEHGASFAGEGTPPSWLHSMIETPPADPDAIPTLRFRSSYQGEATYHLPDGRELRFRWAKVPFRWSFMKPGERYWNFDTQEKFEAEMNGNHGMVTLGTEPVDSDALEAFRREQHAGVRTGFFCHLRHGWIACEPTALRLSQASWEEAKRLKSA